MKTSCILTLLGGVALFAGYFWVFYGRVELPAVVVLSIFGTVGSLVALGGLQGLVQGRRDARLLTAAGGPLRDGEPAAAAGTIVPLGEPLRTPFRGQPCVAYEYEVFRWVEPARRRGQTTRGPQKVVDFSGFALTPSVIRTPRGEVRLLGYPVLEAFPAFSVSADADLERAADYLATAPAAEMQGFQLGKIFSEVKDLLTDDDGAVRKDWRMSAPTRDFAGRLLEERLVPPGEPVVALGHYSAARGGLVPSVGQHGAVNRLYPGTAAEVKQRLGGETRTRAWISLAIFVLLHAMLALVFFASGPKLLPEALP